MIRRLFFFIVAALLIGVPATGQPAPKLPPTEPVQRTAADIEAMRMLEAEGTRAIESMTPRAVSHITFPATINVGITPYINCSDWVLNDRPVTNVITMSLRDYAKNVLPNEWVNTWPTESIRAGAVAVKMFAWWRINLTEQYPGVFRPEGVHVVDNTCDQVYFNNSNRPPTDAAVDFTWPYRLHLNEFVQEIHYLAYDFQCADAFAAYGGGWSRCLPQWTTKDMADQGASWQVMVNQFYAPISISVTGDIPLKTNVIQNPDFSSGTQYWNTGGNIQGTSVVNGVFQFHSSVNGNPGRLVQNVARVIPANGRMRLKIKLGNASDVPKQITIRLLRTDNGALAGTCTFAIGPDAPLRKYVMWGMTPAEWTGIKLEITGDSQDGAPSYTLDSVDLQYRPGTLSATPCQRPLPGVPQILTPAAGLVYGHEFTVALAPGANSHVAGYDDGFHIQIDDSSTFASPLIDNGTSLSPEPSIPIDLPQDGTWYIRARQFDGVGLYSAWTSAVRFTTETLPDRPSLVSPVGDVPAEGQSFIWMATGDTDRYIIKVKNSAGQKIIKLTPTPVEANCSSVCTIAFTTLPVALTPGGTYRWWVTAANENGQVASPKARFTLVVP